MSVHDSLALHGRCLEQRKQQLIPSTFRLTRRRDRSVCYQAAKVMEGRSGRRNAVDQTKAKP